MKNNLYLADLRLAFFTFTRKKEGLIYEQLL